MLSFELEQPQRRGQVPAGASDIAILGGDSALAVPACVQRAKQMGAIKRWKRTMARAERRADSAARCRYQSDVAGKELEVQSAALSRDAATVGASG